MTHISESENRDNCFLLTTFGAFRLALLDADGQVRRSLGPGKPLAAIAYLALAPGRRATRDRLCDLLWGDRELEEAKAQLRQAIWLSKRQLGVALVQSVGSSVELTIPLTVDAQEFAKAVAAGDLESAVQAYSGDFLSQFGSPGAAEYEQWAALERLRLQSTFAHTAESLTRQHLDAGHAKTAERVARRIRDMLPHAQLGWRLLLEALTASGEPILAKAEADHFERWLQDESQEPEPASGAALRAARKAPEIAPGHRSGFEPELVGREHEFSTLQAIWARIGHTGGRVVRVTGPSGLGKSRIVGDFFARLRSMRGRAVFRRANPGDRQVRFALLAAIASDLVTVPGARGVSRDSASVLVGLNPALSSYFDVPPDNSDGEEALRRRAYAVLELITAVSSEAPVAMIIDDLHWADGASRSALELIAARLDRSPVLLVATSRKNDVLHNAERATNIALAPLTREQIEQLVASIAPLPDASWSILLPTQLLDSSEGNPLVVLECLRLCVEEDVLGCARSGWTCTSPSRLRDMLQQKTVVVHRLVVLSDWEQRLLGLLAVAGVPLPKQLAATALQLDPATATAAISGLEQHGFASVLGDDLSLSHDSLAEASIERLSPQALADLHERLASAMMSAPDARWAPRAVRHFADAKNWRSAAQCVALRLPAYPTRRGLQAAVASSLGEAATPQAVESIINAIPFRPKYGRAVLQTLTATGLALITTAVIAFARRPTGSPDVSVFVVEGADSIEKAQRFDIDAQNWVTRAGGPPDPVATPLRRVPVTAKGPDLGVVVNPARDEWAESFPGDSGGVDIRLCTPLRCHDLTHNPRDNIANAFSPDGTQLAFQTSRWSSVGHPSLAIMSLASGRIRRLTVAPGSDVYAKWSPDGTRLAFTRHLFTFQPDQICIVTVDGQQTRCAAAATKAALVGWLDVSRLLLLVQDAGSRSGLLEALDTRTDSVRALPFPASWAVELDPTGRWALLASLAAGGGLHWQLAPTARPEATYTVASTTSRSGFAWVRASSGPDYIDHAQIDRASDVFANVPTRLSVTAILKSGARSNPPSVTWSTRGAVKASIDSLGVLVAQDTGYVVVVASLGGWRLAEDSVHVSSSNITRLIHETWSGDATSHWTFFGIPAPTLVRADGRNFFFNNGDGSFESGAYTVHGFDGRDGLAIDVVFSAPITALQWQRLTVNMNALQDPRPLRAWNRRTGYLDPYFGQNRCSFSYPSGEGVRSRDRADPIGDVLSASGVNLKLWRGIWTALRLQLFPDGRCGIALNGVAYIVQPARGPLTSPIYVSISGASAHTRVLVGEVNIRSGVPADIDWRALTFSDGAWRLKR